MTSDDSKSDPQPDGNQRVKDLVGENSETLDADTIAQLAAWFGESVPLAQSSGVLDQPPKPRHAADVLPSRREIEANIEAAADQRLLASIDRWNERAENLIDLPPPMHLGIENELAQFDLSRWRLLAVAESEEAWIDEDIHDCLREAVPQAFLRDLHRPVFDFDDIYHDYVDTGVHSGLSGHSVATETMATSYRRDLPALANTPGHIAKDLSALRRELRAPWVSPKDKD